MVKRRTAGKVIQLLEDSNNENEMKVYVKNPGSADRQVIPNTTSNPANLARMDIFGGDTNAMSFSER